MTAHVHTHDPRLHSFLAGLVRCWVSGALLLAPWVRAENAAEAPASLSAAIDRAILSGSVGPDIPHAGDAEFLRRIFLDLVGRGPSRDESRAYMARLEAQPDRRSDVRRELVDDLLERDEFSRHQAKVIEVMLTERREVIGPLEIRQFIKTWLDDRRPLNELWCEVLAADGTGKERRAAAGFIINRKADPHLVTRDISRIFFGRDIQCAQCHDHPLVPEYGQAEYHGLLAFVHRTYLFEDEVRGRLPFLGEKAEGTLDFGSVFRPEDGTTRARPVLPGAIAMDVEPDFVEATDAYLVAPAKDKRAVPRVSRRRHMAALATHPENDAFNRNLANRLWANLFGMGVVHPVDMHHSGNPPVRAELLRVLVDGLVSSRYDMRAFLRQIVLSDAYQRSALPPDVTDWPGPAGGVDALDARALELRGRQEALQTRCDRLRGELEQAARGLHASLADVDRLQATIEEERRRLADSTKAHADAVARHGELAAEQARHLGVVAALQAALDAADDVLKVTPDDAELVASRALLGGRLQAASDASPAVQQKVEHQHEAVHDLAQRVEDQRGRISDLADRKAAFGGFVIESRGVQRRLLRQMQALIDEKTDCEQQQAAIAMTRRWLDLRRQRGRTVASGDACPVAGSEALCESLERELIQSWRRSFAVRTVRSLSPEQITGSLFTALEMDKPVRAKASADWAALHATNPAEPGNAARHEAFVGAAIAAKMWDTVEDPIVERFSAPAGNPQDAFFATVDQALMIQNDPTVQSWLASGDAVLCARLAAIEDPATLCGELTWSILCRPPDDEEIRMVTAMLDRGGADREATIRELVWGLLASSEFRFAL